MGRETRAGSWPSDLTRSATRRLVKRGQFLGGRDLSLSTSRRRSLGTLPRYCAKPCDESAVPLQDCPTCGYALSIVGQRCRHCAHSLHGRATWQAFNPKQLPQMISALVALGFAVYLVFFR